MKAMIMGSSCLEQSVGSRAQSEQWTPGLPSKEKKEEHHGWDLIIKSKSLKKKATQDGKCSYTSESPITCVIAGGSG